MEEKIKIYDLEERTALFAEKIRDFVLKIPGNAANNEYGSQLIRAGSSPGSNYIEANENLGEKDFKMKLKSVEKNQKKLPIGFDLLLLMVLWKWKKKDED